MNKFKKWLKANPGTAVNLAKRLGVHPSNITNVLTGRLLMPTGWMATIIKMSKQELTYEDMVIEREHHRKAKNLIRQNKTLMFAL